MYEPRHFKIEDRDELFALIRANPLGLLISVGEDGIEANPVPFTLAKGEGGEDLLRCHLARANGQWQRISEGGKVLIAFSGGDHYVTPAWYKSKKEHGKVVPTWNYVHVQVRGTASVKDDTEFLSKQVRALTSGHEQGRKGAWAVDDAPEAYIAAQMRGIVGIEIEIRAISGKFKLSQNRDAADFGGVVTGLSTEVDSAGPAMATFIAEKSGLLGK